SGAKILIGQPDLVAPLLEAHGEVGGLERIFCTGDGLAGTKPLSALFHAAQADLAVVCDDHLAVMLYTSGTTARPKGVMHSHATLRRQNANCLMLLGPMTYAQTLVALPLCHIAAFSFFLLVATEAAGTVTILPSFEPGAVLRTIGENRI